MNIKHLFIALSLAVGTAAQAKTILVTNSSNANGDGTFLRAMSLADEDGDIIEFSGFTTPPIIRLNSSFNIIKDLTIKGNGATLIGREDQNFFVIGGAEVTLEDLVFEGMDLKQSVIHARTNNLTINRCRFSNNKAGDRNHFNNVNGSVIYISPSDRNREGVLNIQDSDFIGNELNSLANGGAIYVDERIRLNVNNSIFENNRTNVDLGKGGGGAIAIKRRPFSGIHTITNSTFTNNRADTGGAIYSYESDTNIVNSTFANNRAHREGSAVNGDGNGTGTTYTHNISRSTFLNNHSLQNATVNDAIFIDNNTLNLSNSILLGRTGHSLCATYNNTTGEVVAKNNVLSDNSCMVTTPENNKVIQPRTSFSNVVDTNLVDNGCKQTVGPTVNGRCVPTLNLVANSPAINIGTASNLTTAIAYDQRGEGYARVTGGSEDAGAIEFAYIMTVQIPDANKGVLSCDKKSFQGGDTVTCTATPKAGYRIASFNNNLCRVVGNDCILDNLTASQSLGVTFIVGSGSQSYTIRTAFMPTEAGTFSCDKSSATATETVTCTATPDASKGYTSVSFDNANCVVDANNANVCKFTNLNANQLINATFSKSQPVTPGTIFEDSFDNSFG